MTKSVYRSLAETYISFKTKSLEEANIEDLSKRYLGGVSERQNINSPEEFENLVNQVENDIDPDPRKKDNQWKIKHIEA